MPTSARISEVWGMMPMQAVAVAKETQNCSADSYLWRRCKRRSCKNVAGTHPGSMHRAKQRSVFLGGAGVTGGDVHLRCPPLDGLDCLIHGDQHKEPAAEQRAHGGAHTHRRGYTGRIHTGTLRDGWDLPMSATISVVETARPCAAACIAASSLIWRYNSSFDSPAIVSGNKFLSSRALGRGTDSGRNP